MTVNIDHPSVYPNENTTDAGLCVFAQKHISHILGTPLARICVKTRQSLLEESLGMMGVYRLWAREYREYYNTLTLFDEALEHRFRIIYMRGKYIVEEQITEGSFDWDVAKGSDPRAVWQQPKEIQDVAECMFNTEYEATKCIENLLNTPSEMEVVASFKRA